MQPWSSLVGSLLLQMAISGSLTLINAGRDCGQQDGTLVPEGRRKTGHLLEPNSQFSSAGMEGVKPSVVQLLSLQGKQR